MIETVIVIGLLTILVATDPDPAALPSRQNLVSKAARVSGAPAGSRDLPEFRRSPRSAIFPSGWRGQRTGGLRLTAAQQ